MNVFSLFGDGLHVLSFILLIYKVFKTQSAKGISGKMQLLFVLVFMTRYLDLTTTFISVYNTAMKIMFITVSYVMVYLVYLKFPREEKCTADSFRIESLVASALILALFVNYDFTFIEVSWAFSIYLEAVAVIPQLVFVRNTGEVDIYTCISISAFAAYRGFYVINWIYRYMNESRFVSITFYSGLVHVSLCCFTAGVMIAKLCKDTRKSELATIDDLKGDIVFVHPGIKGGDVITQSYEKTSYHPVFVNNEMDLWKKQNQLGINESLPYVFNQKCEK